jgi:O-antigen chain-terminating methyltransferase
MILKNNPAIDVDELMQRVRAEAEHLRASGAIEFRRGEPRNLDDVRLARALDQQRVVAGLLAGAENANQRFDVPRRLQRFGPLARFLTRIINYLFKRQREYNANLTTAAREMLAMQTTIGESVMRAIEDLRGIERYRIESFRELRTSIDEFKSHLAGLDFAHHYTREMAEGAGRQLSTYEAALRAVEDRAGFAHDRIDSAESDLHAISGRLASLAERAGFAHQRIDSAESDVRAISERLASIVDRADVDSARTDEILRDHSAVSDRLRAVHERTEFAHRRVDSSEQTLAGLANHLAPRAEVRLQIVDASRELEKKIADTYESMLRALAVLRGEISAGGRPAPAPPAMVADVDDTVHAFLADRFRGARADIGERLAAYLPIVRAAGTVGKKTPLLDAGPGRGEWLAHLNAAKVPAFGVESNRLLADECRAQGLAVEDGDLLSVLRARAPGSLGALTAFHVVEHLPFPYLVDTLREAVRVLAPGGIIVFETPDPRNLIVASQSFYLDPTHLHPVPRELLQALLEAVGFAGCDVLELHPPEHPFLPGQDDLSVRLNAVFSHPLDYALVARAPRG